jgi:hypothetical protein
LRMSGLIGVALADNAIAANSADTKIGPSLRILLLDAAGTGPRGLTGRIFVSPTEEP